MRVAIHHRNEAEAASALAAETGGGPVLAGDFAQASEARRVVKQAAAALGGLDTLVYCCAVLHRAPFLETTDADFARVQAVNLEAAFAASQEAARLMVAEKFGRIVLVTSVNEFAPNAGLAAYAASKGGLRMLGRTMALESRPTSTARRWRTPPGARTSRAWCRPGASPGPPTSPAPSASCAARRPATSPARRWSSMAG